MDTFTRAYTVLLLNRDWIPVNGSASDWIARVCVECSHSGNIDDNVICDAIETAQYKAAQEHGCDPADFDTIAVYEGSIFDLFAP